MRVWLSPRPALDEFAAALAARGVAVDRVAEVDSRWDWRACSRTWTRLRRVRPDVLHVHHVWPAADRYLAALARAAGVPHLWSPSTSSASAHSERAARAQAPANSRAPTR